MSIIDRSLKANETYARKYDRTLGEGHGAAKGRLGAHQTMNVLVIDVEGSHVKVLATGRTEPHRFESGPSLAPRRFVTEVRKITSDWTCDAVSIGYPGPVLRNLPVSEPYNLGPGWVGFNFQAAFGRPVKLINDAAMQALGSYKSGKMLFLGFGTGLGSAMVVDGIVEPMELGHLPYKEATFEDYVGQRGLERLGKQRWRKHVANVVAHFTAAPEPEDIVPGGGNMKHIEQLPPKCRAGDNANAFRGGFRMWEDSQKQRGFEYANTNGTTHEPAAHGAAGLDATGGPSSTGARTAFARSVGR
jgi:polyphosphate glucokinase